MAGGGWEQLGTVVRFWQSPGISSCESYAPKLLGAPRLDLELNLAEGSRARRGFLVRPNSSMKLHNPSERAEAVFPTIESPSVHSPLVFPKGRPCQERVTSYDSHFCSPTPEERSSGLGSSGIEKGVLLKIKNWARLIVVFKGRGAKQR